MLLCEPEAHVYSRAVPAGRQEGNPVISIPKLSRLNCPVLPRPADENRNSPEKSAVLDAAIRHEICCYQEAQDHRREELIKALF